MRAPPVLLILLLCLVVVAGCQQGSVSPPPALAPFFPTVTPTPPPTPTREGEIVIPFDTIAAGSLLQAPAVDDGPENTTVFGRTSGNPEDLVGKGPFAFIATSPDETTSFEQWLQPETSSEISKLDFQKYVVIAFFKGLSGPCCDGYVSRIATNETGTITIYATLRSQPYGPEAMTFPGHIVRIQRTDVPFPITQDVQLHLVTNQVWVP